MRLIDMIVATATTAGAMDQPAPLKDLYLAFQRRFPDATTGASQESFAATLAYHCINMRSRFPDPRNKRATAAWLREPLFKRVKRGQYMLLSPSEIDRFKAMVARLDPLIYADEYDLSLLGSDEASGNLKEPTPAAEQAERVRPVLVGKVRGTPRTYGDSRSEDKWRQTIVDGSWTGRDQIALPISELCSVQFDFRVNPHSPKYHGHASPNGPDVDTMAIGAFQALAIGRAKTPRPTLGVVADTGKNVHLTCARKQLVPSDGETGVSISLREQAQLTSDAFLDLVPAQRTPVTLGERLPRSLPAQVAAAATGLPYHARGAERIGIRIAVNSAATSNKRILDIDLIEAAIDGLGASDVVGGKFFAATSAGSDRFGYDDSVVFSVVLARVHGLEEYLRMDVFESYEDLLPYWQGAT